MPPDPVERKLTAILSADVVGYPRLMAEDEPGTIRRKRFKGPSGVR
jgi:class 3 adenylate cyclase